MRSSVHNGNGNNDNDCQLNDDNDDDSAAVKVKVPSNNVGLLLSINFKLKKISHSYTIRFNESK